MDGQFHDIGQDGVCTPKREATRTAILSLEPGCPILFKIYAVVKSAQPWRTEVRHGLTVPASICKRSQWLEEQPVHFPRRSLSACVSAGTIACRSPTTPKRASLKMGASASLLIATIVFDVRIPAKC